MIAATADRMLPCVAVTMPRPAASGSSTKANSLAPVSTEPARSASPRLAQVTRNSAHTTNAFKSVMTTAAPITSARFAHTIFRSMVMPTPMKNRASSRPRNGSMSASSSWRYVELGEQHTGEEGAERHRHADDLHQQRGAEHDQQSCRGHHLARAGPGQQAEERIEQIAAREHQRGDRAGDQRGRARGLGHAQMRARLAARCHQRHQREQRHHRHVLEQQDREGALAVRVLQMAALLQDAQRDRGGGEREREPGDERAAPVEPAAHERQPGDGKPGDQNLRDAEAENILAHGKQAVELQLKPDQKQQHHHAELGHGQDALGRRENAEPVRADDHAGDQIGDDRGKPREARERHADHQGGEQHEREAEEVDAGRMMIHGLVRSFE